MSGTRTSFTKLFLRVGGGGCEPQATRSGAVLGAGRHPAHSTHHVYTPIIFCVLPSFNRSQATASPCRRRGITATTYSATTAKAMDTPTQDCIILKAKAHRQGLDSVEATSQHKQHAPHHTNTSGGEAMREGDRSQWCPFSHVDYAQRRRLPHPASHQTK